MWKKEEHQGQLQGFYPCILNDKVAVNWKKKGWGEAAGRSGVSEVEGEQKFSLGNQPDIQREMWQLDMQFRVQELTSGLDT